MPLTQRGVEVHGIELSPHMVDQTRKKPGGGTIPVTIGDMASSTASGRFTLVYLVWNAITNVTTQQDQIAIFRNAAAHLAPGGRFVVEVIVPQLRRVPAGETARVFINEPDHVAVETFDDLVGQIRRGRITGCPSTAGWCITQPHTATYGPPSWTSWPRSAASNSSTGGRTGIRGTFTSESDNQVVVYKRH